MYINPQKAGLALGGLFGLLHFLWSFLVALGFAQLLVNFIFVMHFIKPIVEVGAFNLTTAIGLIIITSVVGFIVGNIFARIWNKVCA